MSTLRSICEYLEARQLLTVYEYTVPAQYSSAYLLPTTTQVAATAALSDGVGYTENDGSSIGTGHTSFAGRTVDNTSVLVKYTFLGNANLDGNVNLSDFNRLSANFGQTGPWGAGDFNYDTNVNLADFNLLSGNFGSSGLSPLGGEGEYTVEDLLNILMEMYPEYF